MIYTHTTGDGKTGAELFQDCDFDWGMRSVRTWTESMEFPLSKTIEQITIDFVVLDRPHAKSFDQILAELYVKGATRPTAEDALRFAAKYPETMRQEEHRYIIFPHEVLEPEKEFKVVLALGLTVAGRGIAFLPIDQLPGWNPEPEKVGPWRFARRLPKERH